MEANNATETVGRNQVIVIGSALLSGISFANVMDTVDLESLSVFGDACLFAAFISILCIGLIQISLMSSNKKVMRLSKIMALISLIVVVSSVIEGSVDYATSVALGIVCAIPAVSMQFVR